jgi:hypothetical protein
VVSKRKVASLGHDGYVTGAAFSPDGALFVTSTADLTLHFWDARSWRQRWQVAGQPSCSRLRCFLPHGHSFLAQDAAGGLSVWEAASGKERMRLQSAVAVGPGADEGHPRQALPQAPPRTGASHAVAVSADGKLLACDEGNAIRVRQLASGKELRRLVGHRDAIFALAFSPDGRWLASASGDTTALVWDGSAIRLPRDGARLTSDELNVLWDNLAARDAALAYRAILRLAQRPAESVPYLGRHLRAAQSPDARQVARRIGALDSEEPAVRERAMQELRQLGELVVEELRQALAGSVSAEARRRYRELIGASQGPVRQVQTLRALRALEVLEEARTGEARRVIRELAGGVPQSHVTRAARAALGRLQEDQVSP